MNNEWVKDVWQLLWRKHKHFVLCDLIFRIKSIQCFPFNIGKAHFSVWNVLQERRWQFVRWRVSCPAPAPWVVPRCYQSPAAPGLGGGGGNEPILSGCGHCCSVLMEAEWGQWLEFILSCFMSRWLINIGFSWYLEIFRDIAVVSSSLWRRGQHQ